MRQRGKDNLISISQVIDLFGVKALTIIEGNPIFFRSKYIKGMGYSYTALELTPQILSIMMRQHDKKLIDINEIINSFCLCDQIERTTNILNENPKVFKKVLGSDSIIRYRLIT